MKNKYQSTYKGYRRIDFDLNNHIGSLICPEKPAKGNPWIWRAEFLGDFDKADMELVRLGWHLAYYKVSDMYGCPKAVELMADFHDYIVKEYGLCEKTVLFGFSRGGLYSVNYAVKYPEKVKSIYLDAPVINMQSWPKKHSSSKNWSDCLCWYGFDEDSAMEHNRTQLERAAKLAENKIPMLVVAGDSDPVVPYEENAGPFVEKYLETSDTIEVIIKKGCAHHPHSLEDVSPIIDFVTGKSLKTD